MRIGPAIIALLGLSGFARPVHAEDISQTQVAPPVPGDYTVVLGVAGGTAKTPGSGTDKKAVDISGSWLGVGRYDEFGRNWESRLAVYSVVDVATQQMVSLGADGGFSYALSGGPRRMGSWSPMGAIETGFSRRLGLAFRGGYQQFHVSNPQNPQSKLTGSVLPVKTGFELRFQAFGGVVGVDLMYVPLTFAASVERVSYTGFEVLFGSRFFL